MKWRNWLSAVIGAWLLVSPWFLGLHNQIQATNATVLVGLIQAVVSIWAALTVRLQSWKTWQNWVAFLCGAWFFVQPFLGHYELGQYYATVAAGLLTILVNMWSLIDNHEARQSGDKAPA
ncbi:SPW repeat protein [Alicyclobacillus curvatus]|nr:SPW repeat protein [Alicyclobacillus curvatus]